MNHHDVMKPNSSQGQPCLHGILALVVVQLLVQAGAQSASIASAVLLRDPIRTDLATLMGCYQLAR